MYLIPKEIGSRRAHLDDSIAQLISALSFRDVLWALRIRVISGIWFIRRRGTILDDPKFSLPHTHTLHLSSRIYNHGYRAGKSICSSLLRM